MTWDKERDEARGARALAATVLGRVWQDAAYASVALDAELGRHPGLDPRDAALATELVYGVLRTSGWLERTIAKHATGDRYRRKPLVRAHMLMAAYSIAFLERVPPFAAVSEAVAAVKREAGTQVAGFANAVLRKLAGDLTARGRGGLERAIAESPPGWLRAALAEALGSEDAARSFLSVDALPAANLCVRGARSRDEVIARIAAARPDATVAAGLLSERCVVVRGGGDPEKLPGAGLDFGVQEEGAQVIALAVGAQPGETILDACAGRGGKTLLLAELIAPGGAVDACDRHPQKLARIVSPMVRERLAVDWTVGSGGLDRTYDRVLVDAPCTGTGTLRRRPEIAERLGATDPERMAVLQLAIAARVAERLRPGGRMIYAVCSVLRPECEGVVLGLAAHGLEPAAFDSPLGARLAEGGTSFRLAPHLHGTDGYFVASLIKR
ncbi:MAG: Sun protein [Deltaproteobacteria bacterium]|nr:Sun protein [Deltaproteobacteria bacterium]